MAIALLNWADDHGYFMAHPSLLRGGLFPFLEDSKNIPGTLQDLSRVGWIELGNDNQGRPVGRILNFTKHQRVDKPQTSKIKDLCIFQDHSKNVPRSFQEPSKEEGNGIGKGIGMEQGMVFGDSAKQKNTARAKSPEEVEEFALSIGCDPGQGTAAYWKWEGNGWINGKAPIKDWKATVRSWKSLGYAPFRLSSEPVIQKSFAQQDKDRKEADRHGDYIVTPKLIKFHD